MHSGIWVYIDHFQGELLTVSSEVVTAARLLADKMGLSVTAIVCGHNIDDLIDQIARSDVDYVIACDDITMADFRYESFGALLAKLYAEHKPKIILMPSTHRCRDLIATLSVKLDVSAITDGVDLNVENDIVQVTRPVYAGKLNAKVSVSDLFCQIISIRPRTFAVCESNQERSEVLQVDPVYEESEIVIKVVSYDNYSTKKTLSDSSIVVSGGRGGGGPEGFQPVRQLAETLDGALGASRAAVDSGWISYDHQVGQTGKTVSPDLYIACGISGAIQHQAGMRTSKIIVAINKDVQAPIMKFATYGIVADLFDFIPVLIEELNSRSV